MNQAISAPARLGLGCATFGREIDAAAAFVIMDHARAHGIDHFDTAPAYGDGSSERIVGEWLASRSPGQGFVVATKVKPPYTAARIRESVDASRRRLGRDRIDRLYLHEWDATAASDEAILALGSLVKTGTVGTIGASNVDLPRLGELHRRQAELGQARVGAIQNNHNLAVRNVDEPLTLYCRSNDIEVVTYSPLGAGFLTGKHRHQVQPGSRFALVPAHQDIYFQPEAQRRLEQLQVAASRTGLPSALLALAWALHQPATTMVLIGARTTDHLTQAFAARSLMIASVLPDLS